MRFQIATALGREGCIDAEEETSSAGVWAGFHSVLTVDRKLGREQFSVEHRWVEPRLSDGDNGGVMGAYEML